MATGTPTEAKSGLDRFFHISERGSTVGTEIRGGVVTFVTMAYIVILNPIILSGKPDVAGNELTFEAVGAATALTAGVMTILFGLVTRLPFAFAAGLGINAFVAFSVVGHVTWPEAMALVAINGVLIVLLAATGLRKMIFDAVPMQLKIAITVAIGFFIAFIGFVNAGFSTSTTLPSPPVELGQGGSIASISTLLFVITVLITGALVALKVKGALLLGLVAGSVIAGIINLINPQEGLFNFTGFVGLPDLSLIGAVDFSFDFTKVSLIAIVMLVFTLLFSNFFDAMGTMTGLATEAGLADKKGDFPSIKSALVVEGVGAIAGGLTSTSSNTVFVESSSGIGEGARTGLANVVTGALFIVAMFFTPITGLVPGSVAAAALVIVGAMMMGQIKNIDLSDFAVLLPVFVTVATMPLTYSIANGIGAGFVTWVVVQALAGKAKTLHPLMWIVAAGFVIFFARGPIEALFA
ncbi:NCS2 family permease [Microbacterium sp. NC79]|uniref:NCS2 family permease n=1 Tax=Microbacterium sp. NC79 TaxID=2851009 RepID=UPI001C2CA44F|nr:NCS2 family permease [Microbacterium sp. NC79]MBV0894193.1 NCS2 family permease [Microbacterium sp. NC79]